MDVTLFETCSHVIIMRRKVDPWAEGGARILIKESSITATEIWRVLEKPGLIKSATSYLNLKEDREKHFHWEKTTRKKSLARDKSIPMIVTTFHLHHQRYLWHLQRFCLSMSTTCSLSLSRTRAHTHINIPLSLSLSLLHNCIQIQTHTMKNESLKPFFGINGFSQL